MINERKVEASILHSPSILGVDLLEEMRATRSERGQWLIGAVMFPRLYLWFVLLATADVALTWMILGMGGHEVNAFAHWIMAHWGITGAVVLKFTAVAWVLCVCEFVGRRREPLAHWLAEWCVALNAIPVTVGLFLIYVKVSGMPM